MKEESMKRSIFYVALCTLLLSVNVDAADKKEEAKSADSTVKVAYVDLNRALNEVEEGKKAKAQLEGEGNALRKKIELKQKEIQQEKENLDKQRPILSAEASREKEMKLQQAFMELQKMGAESEKTFAEKEGSYIKPIGEKLKKIILKLGQERGYAVILPKEMILYAPEGNDLTNEVIRIYNTTK